MDYKLIYLARRNPSVRQEDWPAIWLSHAKFAGQFPMIRPNFRSIHYCTRIITPTLDGALLVPPAASTGFDGVAIVSCPAIAGLNIEVPPDIRARIDEDEMRVFSTVTPNFSFKAKEDFVYGGAPGLAVVIRFLAKGPDQTAETFTAHWRNEHTEIVGRAADASGIVRRHVHNGMLEAPPRGYKFDGIAETWFSNPEDALRSLVDDAFAPVAHDLSQFCDLKRSVTMLTTVIRRWPVTD
jgi:hypothetical protein